MKNVNNKYRTFNNLIFVIVLLLFNSCKSQVALIERKCTLLISDKKIILDAVDDETLKNQVAKFYNDNNPIDIIYYKSKSGEKDLNFKRIFKDTSNHWFYVEIQNSVIVIQREITVNESELDKLFDNFRSVSMYRNCGICLHCDTYTSLIKKGNKTFSYYYDSSSGKLSDENLQKLEPYQRILDFFRQDNLYLK